MTIKKISLATLLATTLFTTGLTASSHREAPAITESPKVDSTDFYMFNSYETGRTGYTTLIANYIPLQDPQGGPNYFAMDPDAVYDIHIDNDGDSVEDLTFRFRFTNTLENGTGKTLEIDGKTMSIPLNALGSITASDTSNLGLKETYSLELIKGDRKTGTATTLASSLTKPYDNVGNKTFPDYEAYANSYINSVAMTGCSAGDMKVFVGQRKESFVVNLGEIFDLVNFVPIVGSITSSDANNDLRNKNITSIAIEVPTACLLTDSTTVEATKKPIIGAWTTASLPQARILRPKGQFSKNSLQGGALTQVSRLSAPLVNEVVIGLKDKDLFNTSEPKDDGTNFLDYVTNPTFPVILDSLFRTALGATSTLAPTNSGRVDLVAAFLTGLAPVNQNGATSEMLRLNTGVVAKAKASQNAFGVVAGDLAGFPNGRRPGDDVVDLVLRVAMGALCHPVQVDLDGNGVVGNTADNLGLCTPTEASTGTTAFTDGAPIDATYFDDTFPYLKTPLAGSPN